ncbi:TPA: ImmA/IrrE family metallo-endopeptidase [Campylobacter jejuni]|nr:ImmA/IrrE family metallo-endopeptidase [Campylobacter jejuni]HDZ5012317.1 ImmA/IrrE family metallo-endopeptidase [Campylobacter jejuni]HDZ5015992.1 ImmA/IrrE family metallo-endopeptidase [Campylobacter jejuni]HDZ5024130.1 ImmA/IrrE family metallo-endopeptidase [Campylobacter jejuni]HDZ5032937.1 ImmA/IrrE family metallo-endopeptidase [Campylobacter jejuni]
MDKKTMIESKEIRNSFDVKAQKKAQEIADLLEKIWHLIPQSNEMAMAPEQVLNLVYPEKIQIPVDPFKIAEYFNIKIEECKDMEKKEGEVVFNGKKIIINYKPSGFINRDRFTIAHELGHVFLHFLEGYKFDFKDNDIKSGFNDDAINEDNQNKVLKAARSDNKDRFEVEANEFAGQLLVPKKIINEMINNLESNKIYIQSALCKYFKVSNGTMYHTLKMYNVWEKYVQDDLRWY